MNEFIFYNKLLVDIKQRIRQAQTKAILSANSEMISMYWDIGKMLVEKQKVAGWGAGVIPKLSKDIHNELPEIKGFSERNIGYMIRFAKEYETSILQQAVAKLPNRTMLAGIPWGHHILLIEKIKDLPVRFWYINQAARPPKEDISSIVEYEALSVGLRTLKGVIFKTDLDEFLVRGIEGESRRIVGVFGRLKERYVTD